MTHCCSHGQDQHVTPWAPPMRDRINVLVSEGVEGGQLPVESKGDLRDLSAGAAKETFLSFRNNPDRLDQSSVALVVISHLTHNFPSWHHQSI